MWQQLAMMAGPALLGAATSYFGQKQQNEAAERAYRYQLQTALAQLTPDQVNKFASEFSRAGSPLTSAMISDANRAAQSTQTSVAGQAFANNNPLAATLARAAGQGIGLQSQRVLAEREEAFRREALGLAGVRGQVAAGIPRPAPAGSTIGAAGQGLAAGAGAYQNYQFQNLWQEYLRKQLTSEPQPQTQTPAPNLQTWPGPFGIYR